MKFARLELFLREIRVDSDILYQCESPEKIQVTYNFNNTWFDGLKQAIAVQSTCDRLTTVLSNATPWRDRNSLEAFFPIQELGAVVTIEFSQAPTKPTREKIDGLLRKCLTRSDNAYKATHDSLTELLNKAGFTDIALREISDLTDKSAPQQKETATVDEPAALAIIALDLDYFKQVNDTYGHSYGDIVLKCFARRLENECDAFVKRADGNLQIWVARPSGEEFLIAVKGITSHEQLRQMAETIRTRISEDFLPNEIEWDECKSEGMAAGLNPPPLREREITFSVGISSILAHRAQPDAKSTLGVLKSEADIALYKAKSAGRDRYILFPDILARHGQVLEHHGDTNIVSIDLGRQVGVQVGQEFSVYHPKFTGQEPFLFSDGRTQRRMGKYPRVAMGRLVVFEVQAEIAFCYVTENKSQGQFTSSSPIELIPVGTFTHLLQTDADRYRFGRTIPLAKELDSKIEQIVDSGGQPICIVVSLTNADALISTRGTAFVNQVLASTFNSLRERCDASTEIGQIGTSEFGLVSRSQILPSPGLRALFQDIRRQHSELPEFGIGIVEGLPTSPLRGDASKLNPKQALDLARIPASLESADPIAIQKFTPDTGGVLLSQLRRERKFDQLQQDYVKFQSLGIRNAWVENQVAIAAMQMGDVERSYAAISRSVELLPKTLATGSNHPDDDILRLNFAYIANRAEKDKQASLKYYNQVLQPNHRYWTSDNNIYIKDYSRVVYKYFLAHDPLAFSLDETARIISLAKRCKSWAVGEIAEGQLALVAAVSRYDATFAATQQVISRQ